VAAYVEAIEEPRAERAAEVVLEPLGPVGLYLANGRWQVDAILGLCECPDFRVHNTKRFRIRCKHLFKALQVWGGRGPSLDQAGRSAVSYGTRPRLA